jgi:peptidoglycan/xylan/chitin deacetylase (PgdA/CDA1 family)
VLKRLLKLAISLVVRCCDVARASFLKLAGRKPAPICVVLYYHGIDAAERPRFARQLDQLLRHTRPLDAALREPLNGKPNYSVMTFDDGFISVVQNALPELEQRRIPATIFIPTGSLGGKPAWIHNPAARGFREQVVSVTELAALGRRERITIGSHSISHPNFLKIDGEQAERELRQSKADLEAVVGRPVTLFSFPHGACNERVTELAKAVGYQRVFTIAPHAESNPTDKFVVGRVAVDPGDWPLEFRLKLLGAYRWLAHGPHS